MIYHFNFTAAYEPEIFEFGLTLSHVCFAESQPHNLFVRETYAGYGHVGMRHPRNIIIYRGSLHTCGTPGDATLWLKSIDSKPGRIANMVAKKHYLLLRPYRDGLFLRGIYPSFKKLNAEFKKGDESLMVLHNYATCGQWEKTDEDIWRL